MASAGAGAPFFVRIYAKSNEVYGPPFPHLVLGLPSVGGTSICYPPCRCGRSIKLISVIYQLFVVNRAHGGCCTPIVEEVAWPEALIVL